MSQGSVNNAGVGTTPVTLWAAAAMASLILGVVLVEAPVVVLVALGVSGAGALAVAVFREPRWALIGMLVLLYSYAGWVFSNRAGMSDLTVAVLPLLFVILAARRILLGEHVRIPREAGVLVALGLVWALSAAFALDSGRSSDRIADFVGWALLVTLMVSLLDSVRWYRGALWGIAGAAGALATLTLFQALTGGYDNDFFGLAIADAGRRGAVARSAGPLQANNFAQILVVAVPLAWYLALSTWSRLARVAGFAVAAACTAAIVLTASRGGLIALVAVFALVVVLRPVSRRALLGSATAALVVAFTVMPSSYSERFASIGSVFGSGVESTDDGALRGRASENFAALHMFADHPALGVGVANYPVRYLEYAQEIGFDRRGVERQPHSLYLEALAEIGMVGAAVFFYLLWLALIGPWRARKSLSGHDRLLAEGAFVAVFAYLVAGLFLHSAYPRYLWIVVGLGLAAGRLGGVVASRTVPVATGPP